MPLNVVTIRQLQFNYLVLELFEEVESKAELSRTCLDCLGSVLLHSTRSLPKGLLIEAKDTSSFSLISNIGESLNKVFKILVSKSSKTFNVADFLEKFENVSMSPCNCWFASILCFRNGQLYFYITDLALSCLPHTRLFTDNFSILSSALNVLRFYQFCRSEYSDDSICHLLEQVSNPHRCFLCIERFFLTSKGTVNFTSLLPRFQKVTRLDLDLAECSAEAVSKLFAAIKHESLKELKLSEITLTPAVVESLSQSLPELTALQILQIKDSSGCNLVLLIPVYSSSFGTLKITGLTENAAREITRLSDVFKHKPVDEVKLSEVKRTSTLADALCHLLSELSALRRLSISSLTECSDEAATKLVAAIKHKSLEKLELSEINLTSAAAEALGQLLPELSALRTLSLGSLTECSDKAVTKLVACIKHKNLDQLYLHGINLTSAAAEALGQLLLELSALRTLSLGFLTECSDEAVTKLVASIKHKNLDQLFLRGINLTSAAAKALGQLLPELSALRTLSLGSLTECSDEAVTKLVASIRHKNLAQLYLRGINLTSAVAEALSQLLREPSSLQTLEFCFSDGCTLWLWFVVFIWKISRLEIRGLTESSAEVVLSLIEVIKNGMIAELKLSNVALTSAVTEALAQSLPELSSLQTLRISGSDGCSLQSKELEALFGRFNRPSSLTELSITLFSARGSLGSIANNLRFFPSLRVLLLADLDMGEADLSDLLKNLKFTPDLRSLSLMGNPLGHAVRSMIPYLIEQRKLEVVCFRRRDCSEEDLKYVQEAVKEKRPKLIICGW